MNDCINCENYIKNGGKCTTTYDNVEVISCNEFYEVEGDDE